MELTVRAVVSGLFPTAPRIYRRFGYEVVTSLDAVELPTTALAAVPRPAGVGTRRATAADVDAIREVYDAWGREQNGPLSRRGGSFPATDEEFVADYTGVTVAVDGAGGVCGFATWDRGQGFGEDAVVEVESLLATTADGYRALLATVGSFATVTARTELETSGDDAVRLFLPTTHWRVTRQLPYMVKVLDVPAAVALRRYPPGLTADLRFRLVGDVLAENDAAYAVSIGGGRAGCEVDTGADPDRVLTPHGLALLYAGAATCGNLRMTGHLTGGDVAEDLDWDAAFGGRPARIHDFY